MLNYYEAVSAVVAATVSDVTTISCMAAISLLYIFSYIILLYNTLATLSLNASLHDCSLNCRPLEWCGHLVLLPSLVSLPSPLLSLYCKWYNTTCLQLLAYMLACLIHDHNL